MSPAELKSLIDATPACAAHVVPGQPKVSSGVANTGDQAIADILNAAAGGTVYRVLTSAEFTTWSVATGMRAVIQAEADDVNSALRSSALAMVDVMQGNVPGIDFTQPGLRAVIDAWVSAGKCLEADKASLLADCSSVVGLAEYTFGTPVTAADVGKAIRG